MKDLSEFNPMRRKWLVERQDYSRTIAIGLAEEDIDNRLRLIEFQPKLTHPIPSLAAVRGQEPASWFFKPDEAQQLFDALWESGLRPTRL